MRADGHKPGGVRRSGDKGMWALVGVDEGCGQGQAGTEDVGGARGQLPAEQRLWMEPRQAAWTPYSSTGLLPLGPELLRVLESWEMPLGTRKY